MNNDNSNNNDKIKEKTKDMKSLSKSSSSSSSCLVLSQREHLITKIRLILGSQSPRRRDILEMMGLQYGKHFDIITSPLNETKLQQQLRLNQQEEQTSSSSSSSTTTTTTKLIDPIEYTQILANEKARALAEQLIQQQQQQQQESSFFDKPIIILTSDTIVNLKGIILEKPQSIDDARIALQQLSGEEHLVHTGVSIYGIIRKISNSNSNSSHHHHHEDHHEDHRTEDHGDKDDDEEQQQQQHHHHQQQQQQSLEYYCIKSFVNTTKVKFVTLSMNDINEYIATGQPMDKSGSYGIQGMGGQFVEYIQGDYFNVMGLPMHQVSYELSQAIQTFL